MMRLSRRDVLLPAAAWLALAQGRAFGRDDSAAGPSITFKGGIVQGGLVIGDAGVASEVFVDDQRVPLTNGLFCFGFGPDAAKPLPVRARFAAGDRIEMLTPQKRNFPVQRINGLPEKYVSPPADVLRRIQHDAAAVREARAIDTDETWFSEGFVWPADGPITGIYGSRRILNGEPRAPHYGVDIAAPEGTPIRTPLPGIVTLAEDLYLSGNTMIIDHGHGVSTSYLHMSRMAVKVGDRLAKGEEIGLIGQTGRATGPHLCWRLNWFQTRLDAALVVPPREGDRA